MESLITDMFEENTNAKCEALLPSENKHRNSNEIVKFFKTYYRFLRKNSKNSVRQNRFINSTKNILYVTDEFPNYTINSDRIDSPA